MTKFLIGLAVFALVMMGLSFWTLSRWSELETVPPGDAEQAFTEAIAEAGGGPAYVEISADGGVVAHRELEGPEPVSLNLLNVLAWNPEKTKLLRVGFPFWFVRLKMSDTLNLGTFVSVLARDWENLDLRVSERDLERLGPGVVLDHRLPDGRRILLWTE